MTKVQALFVPFASQRERYSSGFGDVVCTAPLHANLQPPAVKLVLFYLWKVDNSIMVPGSEPPPGSLLVLDSYPRCAQCSSKMESDLEADSRS